MSFQAPVKDILFNIEHLARIDEDVATLPGYEDKGLETAQMVLEACAQFNQDVIAPLNKKGDDEPPTLAQGGVVTSTPGFKDAYDQYVEGGWQSVQHPEEFGGQNMPKTIGAACAEICQTANMGFALCPMLTDGFIEALLIAGSDELKQTYLPNMVAGKWAGTMNLTEPQAGSDLALLRSRAEKQADGTYKIFGNKIFITWGEQDLTENIIHLVLARVDGAPEGIKGISLFVVPKFMVEDGGGKKAGERNDVYCVGLEHKLGIHGSATASLNFGDNGGAVGYLVGQENHGLNYMFVMMNSARYCVGVQGVAMGERAYQQAVGYAKERVQSRPVDGSVKGSATIIHHPDIRRMLMTIRSVTEGCRAMATVAAATYDMAHHHPDEAVRKAKQSMYDFFVPLVKGYCTEMSLETTSLGIQVHGGMGFVEETGAAQYYRDARILPIYEGTTAIQANDLLGRKTARDGGEFARGVAAQIEATEKELEACGTESAKSVAKNLAMARKAYLDSVDYLAAKFKPEPNAAYGGAVPFLMLTGNLVCGWLLGKSLLVAEKQAAAGNDPEFMNAKIATARFYAEHILPRTLSQSCAIIGGGNSVMQMPMDSM